jgi:hypothetical protein
VRRALAIACLALGPLAPVAPAAVPAPRQISIDPFTASAGQHETAVEPDSFAVGDTVVAVFQIGRFVTGGAAGIGWATSVDGGATWTSGVLPAFTVYSTPRGPYTRVSDPAVAYDRVHGVWVASVLGLIDAPDGQDSEIAVSRSADGVTWSPPIVTAPDLATFAHDKNWIVCDNGPASPFAGRCYTLWADVTNGSALAASVSTDGGLTWSRHASFREFDGTGWQPVVQPDGTLVVPYLGSASIESVRSTDGGVTFSGHATISPLMSSNPVGIRAGPLPSAEIDAGGRVYVAWPDCRFRSGCSRVVDPDAPNDIVISSSRDGLTWTPPARVPTGGAAGSLDHLLPGLAVDPTTTGATTRLALAYYTLSPAGCVNEACLLGASLVSSEDAGRTWSSPLQLSRPTSITALAQSNRGRFVGDYISTSFVTGGRAVPVFSAAFATFDGSFHQGVFATPVAPQPAASPGARATLGRVRFVPARPRAGAQVAVSAPVAMTGAPATPRLACTLRVRGRAVGRISQGVSGGRVFCTWRLPGRSSGARATGSLAVTVTGRTVRRSFAFTVA